MALIGGIATLVHPGPIITMLTGIADSRGHRRGCGKREPPISTSTGPRRVSSWQRVVYPTVLYCAPNVLTYVEPDELASWYMQFEVMPRSRVQKCDPAKKRPARAPLSL